MTNIPFCLFVAWATMVQTSPERFVIWTFGIWLIQTLGSKKLRL